jgi:arylsulfatase A-like enzyme
MRVVAVIAEAVLAAAVVGAIEATRAIAAAGARFELGSWSVLAALAGAGAIAAALVVVALAAAIGRIPAVARWTRELAGAGGARTRAVWRGALIVTAFVAVGSLVYAVVAWAHDAFRFIDGGPVGLIVACIVTPVGLGVTLGALALDRRLAPRLATSAALDGRRVWIAAAVAGGVVACGPALALYVAAPAVDRNAIVVGSLLVVAVAGTRLSRIGRRRIAQVCAGVLVVACGIGISQLGAAARARELVGVHGVFGRMIVKIMWSLMDSDRDGYVGASAGGADCDDDDPRRHPTAMEIAGNGIDENCTGSDPARAASDRDAPAPPAPAPRHNIVLISVDAMRADHLGAYGYPRPTSPVLDAFAATAARFEWAMTSCPATRCSIPSLFSGRFPTPLRATRDAAPDLASVLRTEGWDTVAIACCGRFALGTRELAGFTTVDASADAVRMQRPGQSNADIVSTAAVEWLQRRGTASHGAAPFLMWLHFYDPHHPYRAPEAPTRFGDDDVDRYDAEIAFTDQQIGRVLAAIDPATTIVAITADHGDEFGEHGIRFHARSLYNQVVRVPLLVRYPAAAPAVVATPVSIVDVMPTLLELVGVQAPGGMNGRSFAAALRGGSPPARPILMELVPDNTISRNAAAIASGTWKLIWDRRANAYSMFSLTDDPADATDRAGDEPAVLAEMKQRLLEALDRELSVR